MIPRPVLSLVLDRLSIVVVPRLCEERVVNVGKVSIFVLKTGCKRVELLISVRTSGTLGAEMPATLMVEFLLFSLDSFLFLAALRIYRRKAGPFVLSKDEY